jgi:hypothetical protein
MKSVGETIPVGSKAPAKEYAEVEMVPASVLGDEFLTLGEQILELTSQIKALEEELEPKKLLARAMMEETDDSGSWSARADGWSVTYMRPGPRKTIVPELLIQQGVKITQIEKATKLTPSTPFVTFRKSRS